MIPYNLVADNSSPKPDPPSGKLLALFKSWTGTTDKIAECPDIPVISSVDLMAEAVEHVERTKAPLDLRLSKGRAHHYMYVEKVADWKDIRRFLPQNKWDTYANSSLMWPLMWLSSLGSGWSRMDAGKVRSIELDQGTSSNVSIFGSGKWPLADVVQLENNPPCHVTSIPRPLSIFSFQAKTRIGHALTGTVLHSLVVTPSGIYFCALGASSKGTPILGTWINNSLACSWMWGSWPTVASNLQVNMKSKKFWEAMDTSIEQGEFTNEQLLKNEEALYEELPVLEWVRQSGTQGMVELGTPVRLLSSLYYSASQKKWNPGGVKEKL